MMGYGRALSIFLMEFVVMFEASVATAMLSFAAMTAGFGLGSELHCPVPATLQAAEAALFLT